MDSCARLSTCPGIARNGDKCIGDDGIRVDKPEPGGESITMQGDNMSALGTAVLWGVGRIAGGRFDEAGWGAGESEQIISG